MISQGWDDIKFMVRRIFIQSLTLGTTPLEWRENRGIVIPKPNKPDYSEPRAFRIISLTSCFQKLMERVILWYIQTDLKVPDRLTKTQHGFRRGASTESAIHKLTRQIEDSKVHNRCALSIFLDVEGAFDNVSFQALKQGLEEAGIPNIIAQWIYNMISVRYITLNYCETSIRRKATKGSPQGGVLSPLLWNLTLDSLLGNLGINQDFVQAFADDLVIFISGICRITVREVAQATLNKIDRWCRSKGLRLSAVKTVVMLFTRKRNKSLDQPIKIGGSNIELSTQAVYLGVTIDSDLSWTPHILRKIAAANRSLHSCRKAVGKIWGLEPKSIRWIYSQAILPATTYAAVVWGNSALTKGFLRDKLTNLQRQAALMITRGLKSTPVENLEILAGLKPIHNVIREASLATAIRLKTNRKWDSNYHYPKGHTSHASIIDKQLQTLTSLNSGTLDLIETSSILDRHFRSEIPTREAAASDIQKATKEAGIHIFTDGSKRNQLTGAGFAVYREGKEIHSEYFSLGEEPTVFQCELFAIYRAAQWAHQVFTIPEHITFHTDSQAGIKSLNKNDIVSRLVLETLQALNTLGTQHQVHIKWVPGHTGITGNERADELARKGSDSQPIGPKPFVPIPAAAIQADIKKSGWSRHVGIYNKAKISENGKILIKPLLLNNKFYRLNYRNATQARTVTWILTRHSPLAQFQHKAGNFTSPYCEHCPEQEESSEHFIGECIAYSQIRQEIFGATHKSPAQIANIGFNKLFRFIQSSGRLEGDNLFEDPLVGNDD